MTALAAFEKIGSTTAIDSMHAAKYSLTCPRVDEVYETTKFEFQKKYHGRTDTELEEAERGNEMEKNQAEILAPSLKEKRRPRYPTVVADGESVMIRSELARDLIQRVNELKSLLGNISFATVLQLWKRDLASAYSSLQNYPTEGGFLTIVCLLESALIPLKLKQYTRDHLEMFEKALDIGYRKTEISFNDCEEVRKMLTHKHIETNPRIDLDSLNDDDLIDG